MLLASRFRMEGMELYSTVLWHLRREVDLAHLAQEVQAIDRLSPQVDKQLPPQEGVGMGGVVTIKRLWAKSLVNLELLKP